MIKKIVLILLFVGATVGMAFLLYRFFFAAPSPVTPGGEAPGGAPTGGLPTAGEGRPVGEVPGAPGGLPTAPGIPGAEGVPLVAGVGERISSPGTIAVEVEATAGGLNYYNSGDGRFYSIDADGDVISLSDRSFPSVSGTTWSTDGKKAVIEFPDQSKVVYDFDRETQVTLPKHWEDFGFSQDGDTIVAKSIGLDPANRWLISVSSDGSGAKLIEPLGENEDKVVVSVSPDSAIVAFSDTAEPVGFESRDMLPIGQNGENLRSLRVEGFDFTPQWSPDGTKLLYSTAGSTDEYRPGLWVVRADGNSIGGNRVKLNINTWADKCTFAGSDTLYCAAPRELPTGAGLQRDIVEGTPDHLVKIDLISGTSRNVTPAGFESSVAAMKLSGDGSSLFVADTNGQITRLSLF